MMTTREDAARRISDTYDVHCEWAPLTLGGSYLVETRIAGSTAREAEKLAREIAAKRA